jgi:hypothetical protein
MTFQLKTFGQEQEEDVVLSNKNVHIEVSKTMSDLHLSNDTSPSQNHHEPKSSQIRLINVSEHRIRSEFEMSSKVKNISASHGE